MLVRFSVKNFLSFSKKQTLDMTAINTCKDRFDDNCVAFCGNTLLRSAVIYGANASGKSNLLHAFGFFRHFILSSSKDSMSSETIPVHPFLLNQWDKHNPSEFEIEFFLDQTKIRYGFQATSEMVVQEWLYEQEKTVFKRAFEKNDDIIQVERVWEKARGLEERTRKNALFLSVCAQFAVPEAEKIISWLFSKLNVISGEEPQVFMNYTIHQVLSGEYRDDVLAFLRNADTNIMDLSINETPMERHRSTRYSVFNVKSLHNVYDELGNVIDMTILDLESSESLGTQKIFALAGPIIDTLKNGSVLIADELDSRLHPILTKQLVQLFNSPKTNPHNAQLVFNTHDTNLLSCKVYDEKELKDVSLFRKDQIYFAEKDNVEATHLYSLIEFKKKDSPKGCNDASFEKDYLNGIYGAIPFIGDLTSMFASEEQ